MYKILEKTPLNPTVTKMVIEAPLVAKKAEPGQFIIFRASEDGERVPLTIADYDRKAGTVTIIFQIVGGATMELNALNAGDSLVDFVGPLGTPSKLEGLKKVAVVGGGVGCAIAYPTAKKLHELGAEVHSVVGFRNKDLVILEKEFEAVSAQVVKMSDDGSWGEKGLVTNALEALINAGNQYDEVIAIGPIIFRASEDGERVPLTIADYDRKAGTVTIIFQIVGGATMELNALNAGDSLVDFVGPLGTPSKLEGLKKVAVVGGGVGCAIAYPTAKKLHELGAEVHSVVGFRNKDLVILEKEFEAVSAQVVKMSDDGSWGEKGLVTNALEALINAGNQYDEVIAIGPLVMMKFVCQLTKKYGIKTTVSMNPIMIDGTGMCGGCRLTVGGKTKFACVDGPDFDGHEVDFDEAMHRGTMYRDFEAHAREAECELLKKEVE